MNFYGMVANLFNCTILDFKEIAQDEIRLKEFGRIYRELETFMLAEDFPTSDELLQMFGRVRLHILVARGSQIM